MNCQRVHKLKEAYVDGDLPEAQRQDIETHLATCPHCAARVALAQHIQQELGPTLQQVIGTPLLSPAAESRIRARLWEAVEPTPPRPTWLRWVTWGVAPTLALSAVLLLALVIGLMLTPQLPATQQAFITPPAQESPAPSPSALAMQFTQTPMPTQATAPVQRTQIASPTATPAPTTSPVKSVTTPEPTPPLTAVPTSRPTELVATVQPTPAGVPVTPSAVIASGPTPTADTQTTSTGTWARYLEGQSVTCLARRGEEIWAGTAGGEVIRLNTVTGESTQFVPRPATRSGIVGLDVDAQGWIWAAIAQQGVFALDTTATAPTWQPYTATNSGLASDDVRALVTDAGGTVWCATADGVVNRLALKHTGNVTGTSDGRIWQPFTVPDAGPETEVTALATEGADTLWVGVRGRHSEALAVFTGGGLYRLQLGDTTRWDRALSSDDVGIISAIFVGSNGRKWVATIPTGSQDNPHARGGGVVVWDEKAWTLFEALGAGMPSRHVLSVAADDRGRTWVGTDRGLVVYEGTQRAIYRKSPSGLLSDRVVTIVLNADGSAWLATDAGLCHLSK